MLAKGMVVRTCAGGERFVVGIETGGGGRALRDTHLSDDEAVAKMGHRDFWGAG